MKCPACKNKLDTALTNEEIEIDICDACGGIWLDKGEVFGFVHSEDLWEELTSALPSGTPTKRTDPGTGKKMIELGLFDNKLKIDYSPSSEGIWLDRGELEALRSLLRKNLPLKYTSGPKKKNPLLNKIKSFDILNMNTGKYLSEKEKIELNVTYSKKYLFWIKIGYYISGLVVPLVILLALRSVIAMLGLIIFSYPCMMISYYSLLSNRYIITDKKIFIIQGLINKYTKDIPYSRITDTQTQQSFLDRILFDSGTILINTAGSHGFEAALIHMEKPFEVKKLIDKKIG